MKAETGLEMNALGQMEMRICTSLPPGTAPGITTPHSL